MGRLPPAADQEPETTQTLLSDSGSLVQRTVLANGLRILTEQLPVARSAVFGVWIDAGSRDERPDQHGAAHYLEHLLFKATPRRTAFEVNAAIDAVGGEMNAFTSREATCFYAHVRAADLPIAADVVLDVVTAGLMRDQDIEAERQVVLEEIAMHEDDPADVAIEQFSSQVLADPALARPILGTADGIEALPGGHIRDFHRSHYRPEATVVVVVGGVSHDEVVDLVHSVWGSKAMGVPRLPRQTTGVVARPATTTVLRRPAEQAHLVIGGQGLARNDPDKYSFAVFNTILGGGMSSRLFHTVREERGLAYAVYSFGSPYADTGMFGVYCGTRPRKADEAVSVIGSELSRMARDGIDDQELLRGRGSVRGSRVLALEDPMARMSRLGHAELGGGELLSIDELEARIEAVDAADVARVAQRLLDAPLSATVVGPMPEDWLPW